MIAAIALKFIALPKPVRYGIAVVGGALLLWGAWSLWIWQHDKSVVREHEAEKRAVVTEKVLEAERSANRNDTERRVVRERQDAELEDAITEAVTENPDETNLPAGPAVRAVLRELHRQKSGSSDPAG